MSKGFFVRLGLLSAFLATLLASPALADDALNKLIDAKKYDEALKYADEKLPPEARDGAAWAQIARANEALGMVEKALACYLVAWRFNPKDYSALIGAAKIYNKLDQPDNAVTMASKALELNFSAEASWEYARACIKLNRAADAKKALEKVIEADASNAVANKELGNIYYSDKQFDKALPLLRRSYEVQPDADVANKLGKAYLETNNLDSAILYLREAVGKNPVLVEADLELARAYYKQEKFPDAAAEFEKAASKTDLSALDQYARAVSSEKAGNAEGALSAYKAAIAKFGSAASAEALSARLKAGSALLEKKSYEGALAQFQFIASVDAGVKAVPNIYFLLADAYMGAGNRPNAIMSLEKALSLDSKNIEAYARLADLYEKSGQSEKAKQTYEKMMSLSPNDPHVFQVLGEYNLKAKKYAEALKYFGQSFVLSKTAPSAQGMALAAAGLGQWDKARDAAESAVKLDASLADVREVLAKAYLNDKNYAAAREQLEFLVSKRPSDRELLKRLAECYRNLNEAKLLAGVDKKIADIDKSDVGSRVRLAQYDLSVKDYNAAFDLYKEVAALTPQDAGVFSQLYAIALQNGDTANAAAFLKKYLALKPDDAAARKNLGDLLYTLKDADGALAAYRAALKLDPAIKGIFKRYAELVVAKGQQEEVIKVLSGAISSGEADAGAYTTLGMIYQKKGLYAKAVEMYQKASKLEPQNTDALSALAECQAKTGDVNAAVVTYEQVLALNPKLVNEYRELADLYSAQGKLDKAIGAYRQYLDKAPGDLETAKKVGKALYVMKQYADAIKYLEMSRGKGAGDIDFQLALGECYFNTGAFKKAAEVYEALRTDEKVPAATLKAVLKSLAQSYEKDNNLEKAVEVYASYAQLPGQKDPEASFKAASLMEKVNPMRAKKIYEDNIVAFPKDFRNYLHLGILYAKDKATLARSASLLKKASGIADTMPGMWLEMAQVYEKLNSEKEEIDAYKKVLALDPQNIVANKSLGVILMKDSVVTDAMVYLEMANALSPKDPEILTAIGQGYIKTDRVNDAIDALQKAKSLKADDPDMRMTLVQLYKKTGQDKKALEELKQLVEIKRDNKILLEYAKSLYGDGNYKDAEDAIENIKATEPENIEALMTLARIQEAGKKDSAAIETCKEISYINPNYAPALYERAQIHLRQNQFTWAKTFFERTLKADPNFAVAELGLAMIAKAQKHRDDYMDHLERAIQIDPNNGAIKKEYQEAKQ